MNTKLIWKILGLFVSIALIIGGLSGEFVLRGTESGTALVVLGVLFLIWDIYTIVTHKKQKAETEKNAEVNTAPLQDEVKMENDEAPVQNAVLAPAPKGKSTVFDGSLRHFILEHKVSSKYHIVGENQKITLDRVEIGRDPNCVVRFDEQFETVSRRHAAIIRVKDVWKLEAISQTNPTFVNGQEVHGEWFLQHGDVIQCAINGPKLVFKLPVVNG